MLAISKNKHLLRLQRNTRFTHTQIRCVFWNTELHNLSSKRGTESNNITIHFTSQMLVRGSLVAYKRLQYSETGKRQSNVISSLGLRCNGSASDKIRCLHVSCNSPSDCNLKMFRCIRLLSFDRKAQSL